MKKILATTLGVLLALGAVSALAGKQDRENLEHCKADINVLYGDGTRVRLRSIKREETRTELRMMVTPRGAGNQVVVCAVSPDGSTQLSDRAGIALRASEAADTVSLAR
ncbi:MAG: hypothetical protein AAGI72_08850 [Pseudomonadota bacterium]